MLCKLRLLINVDLHAVLGLLPKASISKYSNERDSMKRLDRMKEVYRVQLHHVHEQCINVSKYRGNPIWGGTGC
jgi:hypothetical protein